MTNINVSSLRDNLSDYLKVAIDFNDIITVFTERGNAVILSEDEYSGLLETLYLLSVPGMKEKLTEEINTGFEDCAEFQW
jgi:PHD/YefM family antitoxin component YafN of YafNO toxin-antitoxin module